MLLAIAQLFVDGQRLVLLGVATVQAGGSVINVRMRRGHLRHGYFMNMVCFANWHQTSLHEGIRML